jgi:hypothetical protein
LARDRVLRRAARQRACRLDKDISWLDLLEEGGRRILQEEQAAKGLDRRSRPA